MTRVRRSKEEARAAYDRMSSWYDLLASPSEEKHIDTGLRTLKAEAGESILEIGFGTGHALVSLARSVGSAGQVYGVDISEGMAEAARVKLKKADLRDEPRLICGDGARLPLRDGSVDGVFMSFTLELFDTPRIPLVLDECMRVMRGEGRLCVVSLAKREKGSLPVRVYEWVHQLIPRYVDCRPIPVERVVRQAGFGILEMERRSMWGLPVDVVMGQNPAGSSPGRERRSALGSDRNSIRV
jgi:demethylmenaquinone methyltransferase/2-methoxy-6-polyprenyl-1,4-benzoquinol methylase